MHTPRALRLAVIGVTLALAYGIWYSYSVILVALLREFGWSRSVLAGAFSVFTLVHGGVNPVVGMLCDRLRPLRLVAAGGVALGLSLWADSFISEPWHLYLGFGVFTAIAVAASGWIPALVQVQRDFQDKLGLSLGIVSSGVGLGMLVVVPLTQLLIDAYGWRTAFRVLGAICVLWILPSSLFLLGGAPASRPALPPAAAPGKARSTVTLAGAMRGVPFWLMFAAFFFGNVCAQTLHVHQVAYLVDQGVSAIIAASVVGVVGAASIVGKTGGGWLSDRIEREFVYVAGIAILLGAVVALAALAGSPSSWAIYSYAVLLGLGYSVTASLIPAMVSDRFGGPHFGAIVGACLFGSAAGSATGPWLAGFLFDRT
ncbi:MAG: MFS transporter, partial [Proteobacteria bacterium]|nr:MFS transporter [Pseudomonadota bacterium]